MIFKILNFYNYVFLFQLSSCSFLPSWGLKTHGYTILTFLWTQCFGLSKVYKYYNTAIQNWKFSFSNTLKLLYNLPVYICPITWETMFTYISFKTQSKIVFALLVIFGCCSVQIINPNSIIFFEWQVCHFFGKFP